MASKESAKSSDDGPGVELSDEICSRFPGDIHVLDESELRSQFDLWEITTNDLVEKLGNEFEKGVQRCADREGVGFWAMAEDLVETYHTFASKEATVLVRLIKHPMRCRSSAASAEP